MRCISFRLHHRPDLPPVKRVRNLTITHAVRTGQLPIDPSTYL